MKRRSSERRAAVLLAALTLLVAGCGGSGSGSSVAQRPSTPKVRPEREAPAPRRQTKAEPHGPVARCGPGDLVVSHTELGNGALSHYGTDFDLTNVSPHACSISGYPRIVELEADGRRLGGPARHGTFFTERGPGTVTIARNRDAVFKAGWTENVYAVGKCKPRQVTHFRVVLPGSRSAQTVPYPVLERCTGKAAQESFSVGRIEPPPERRGGPEKAPFTRAALPSERLPRCRDADLLVWTGPDHTAGVGLGTNYSRIDVMNLSDRACAISGIPSLIAVDLHGRRLGFPARAGKGMISVGDRHIENARIGPRRSGVFTYATGGYYNYGRGGCEHRYAAGFRVTLPGAHSAQYVPAPDQRCLRIRKQLTVGPIE
jgi:Protein of unknown function (DUF4232)